MVQHVSDHDFEGVVAGAAGPVVVDFTAAWCPPCRALDPIVSEIAAAHAGTTFVAVDVDDSPALAARYQVLSMPTLVVLERGEERARLVGARPRRRLESDLGPWLVQG